MHVLFLSQYFWPEDFRANDIVLGLTERGHTVTVVTGLPNYPGGKFFDGYSFWKGPFREEKDGVEIIRCPLIRRGQSSRIALALNYVSFALFCSVMLIFRRRKADIVFCWMVSPVTQVLPAIVAKRLLKVPLVLWVMDLWPDSLSASGRMNNRRVIKMMHTMTRWIYRRCDRILGQSRRFVSHIMDVGGLEPGRIVYMPQWEPRKRVHEQAWDEMPRFADDFNVVFTGNIGHSQDFGTVTEAARLLVSDIKVNWVIVGEGDALPYLKQQIGEKGVAENFHLLGRFPFETMDYFYANADVLLATLRPAEAFSRTIPTKIQSYLASGTPLVTAIDGEVAEIVTESGGGIAVEAGNAVALADAIKKIAALSSEERQAMGHRGRQFFLRNFDREELLDRLEALLKEEIKRYSSSH